MNIVSASMKFVFLNLEASMKSIDFIVN